MDNKRVVGRVSFAKHNSDLYERACRKASLTNETFSSYVIQLIKKDLEDDGITDRIEKTLNEVNIKMTMLGAVPQIPQKRIPAEEFKPVPIDDFKDAFN